MNKAIRKTIIAVFFGTLFLLGAGTFWSGNNALKNTVAGMKDRLLEESASKTVEPVLLENIPLRYSWVTVNGIFYRAAGMEHISRDGRIEHFLLRDGSMTNVHPTKESGPVADAVVSLSDYLEMKGIPFLHVFVPVKDPDDSFLPAGMHDYTYENVLSVLDVLRRHGVPGIDLTEEMWTEDTVPSDLFYRTDHHWTAESGMRGAGIICGKMKELYGFPYHEEVFREDYYHKTVYEDWYLGSYGAEVGPLYAGADDFSVFSPKEETDFTFEALDYNGLWVNRKGSFDGALTDRSLIGKKRSLSTRCYYTYIGSNYGICTIVNRRSEGTEKILLIRDSFSDVLLPFMSMNYREVTAIDPRYYPFGTIKEYLDGHDVDAVIMVTGPQTAFNKEFTQLGFG